MTPPGPAARPARATQILRHPKLWLFPALLSALLALLLTLLYMGGILTPQDNLHRLPVGIVNADQGPPLPGQNQNLGAQIAHSLTTADTPGHPVAWHRLTQAQADQQLASAKLDGALVIPANFTASVAALTSTAPNPRRPAMTVLTNPGVGSLGSSLASTIAQQAAQQASRTLGRQLSAQPAAAHATSAARLLLADPITITTRAGHPIGTHSGLGLTAFYYTLLLVLAGFMGANIISSGVDSSLGYADTEIGPWHTRRPTLPISRTQTLLAKGAMTAVIATLTTTLIMVAAVTVLGMDASHLPLLWAFSYCATVAVGWGVQAINAAFGSIGQLVAMFVFIVLALPSSGATIPLQAVPGFYRFLAVFEPMRQLSGGVRAILFFDARADAGLARAWLMIAIGVAVALAFGFAVTRSYDHKGLHRRNPQQT